jgi:ketosteroid isomerase-like protein
MLGSAAGVLAATIIGGPSAHSSVDRALASGARGRRFESCCARGMSQENVKLVRELHDAVRAGGFESAGDYLHPDFEMSQLPLHPEAGTYSAREAAESMEAWMGTFQHFRWEAEEFIDAGDRVVVVVSERGSGRGGGVPLDHRYGTVYTVRDDKIARLQWFHDREQALAAVGITD